MRVTRVLDAYFVGAKRPVKAERGRFWQLQAATMVDTMMLMNRIGLTRQQGKGESRSSVHQFSSPTTERNLMKAKELTKAEVQARQIASRRVTVTARQCDCSWCKGVPRHHGKMLATHFEVA
jgi:hypothetical protein